LGKWGSVPPWLCHKKKAIEVFKGLKLRLKNENGASAIEFALVLPLLIMILFSVFEFGILYNNYLAITHAAREGARLAAVKQFSEESVRERAYPVNPTQVSLGYPNGEVHGEPVEVTVKYNKEIEIPFWGRQTIPLVSRAQMRIEY